MRLSRREFCVGVGSGAVLVGGGALASSLWQKPGQRVLLDRRETWANTVCQLCRSGCGLRLRLANGSPVTVAGNPLHPVNAGGLCARGGAALQLYYDPDRFKGPMRREAALIGGWAPVPWDDGITLLRERIGAAMAAGPDRVAVIRGGQSDAGSELWGRLVRACRSSWVVDVAGTGSDMNREVIRLMHGVSGFPVYDLARCTSLMSFDSGILEASPDAMRLQRSFAEARARGAKFVHAGPRLGVTGSKADTWLPIRPHTAGILALGVAHVLLKEGLVDSAFLRNHVTHFDDFTDATGAPQPGIRGFILREFPPQRVAELTGVGWDRIIRTARQFGSSPRPLAVGPMGAASGFSMFDLVAVHVLNTLVGSIDVPGGVLLGRAPPFAPLDPPARDLRNRTVAELAHEILDKKSIDVVVVHEADPVFASAAGAELREALAHTPFVISTSPVPNETTALAHLVLPDRLWMERRADTVGFDANGYAVVALSKPAVRPLTDGRHSAEVVLALAHALGPSVAASFPWASYEAVVAERIAALFDAAAGDTFADPHRATWAQLLAGAGWRIPTYRSREELAQRIEEAGGWWDPAYYHGEWRRVLAWPGQRIDLHPVLTYAKDFAPQKVPSADYLQLHVYADVAIDPSGPASLPYLQDLGSPLSERGWETMVELNTATAQRLGIAPNARVRVRTAAGEMLGVARVTPTIRPDVLAVEAGRGRQAGGRFARGIGASPLHLLGPDSGDDPSGSLFRPTLVELEKA